jgi:hypothetical protein
MRTPVSLGGRLAGKFNDKWHYKARADIGGGTDGTYNILGTIGFIFNF